MVYELILLNLLVMGTLNWYQIWWLCHHVATLMPRRKGHGVKIYRESPEREIRENQIELELKEACETTLKGLCSKY